MTQGKITLDPAAELACYVGHTPPEIIGRLTDLEVNRLVRRQTEDHPINGDREAIMFQITAIDHAAPAGTNTEDQVLHHITDVSRQLVQHVRDLVDTVLDPERIAA